MKHLRLFLLFLLFSSIISGCNRTPLEEQFVSAKNDLVVLRSNGECNEISLNSSNRDLSPADNGINPEKITIFNWNTYKGQRKGWQRDLLLHGGASDIILLQEVSNDKQLRNFLYLQNFYWNYNSAFRYKGIETGVLIASEIEPLDSCGLRQDEPIIGLPKTALISLYPIKGLSEKLLVANVHGINITLGTQAYREQFSELRNVLQLHHGPMIVAGDFNNWSEKRKAIIDGLIENLAMSIIPFENENRTLVWGDPIDHILYRGLDPIAHTSYEVLSSDHNPIAVTFRLTRRHPLTKTNKR